VIQSLSSSVAAPLLALAVVASSCDSPPVQQARLSVDTDFCAELERLARCDQNLCVELPCWQQTGAPATDCPRTVRTDMNALASLGDRFHDTVPAELECSERSRPTWNNRFDIRFYFGEAGALYDMAHCGSPWVDYRVEEAFDPSIMVSAFVVDPPYCSPIGVLL